MRHKVKGQGIHLHYLLLLCNAHICNGIQYINHGKQGVIQVFIFLFVMCFRYLHSHDRLEMITKDNHELELD